MCIVHSLMMSKQGFPYPCFSLKGRDHIANENLALCTTKTTSRIGGAPSFQVVQGIVAKKTKQNPHYNNQWKHNSRGELLCHKLINTLHSKTQKATIFPSKEKSNQRQVCEEDSGRHETQELMWTSIMTISLNTQN